MSKVSARSAETILSLSKKSKAHKEAIIEIAEEIRKDAGSLRIERLVNEILNGQFSNQKEEIITSSNSQVLAIWKKGGIFFSKNINLDKKKLKKLLIDFFKDKQLD